MSAHPHIPAEAYCGLPFRVETDIQALLFASWDGFKAAGFDVRDMQPRANPSGLGVINGFTAQWAPRLRERLQ